MFSSLDVVAFSAISGVGPATIAKLLDSGYAQSQEEKLLPARIAEALFDRNRRAEIYRFAEKQFDEAAKAGVDIITRLDDTFPKLLKAHFDAPAFLFAKGNLAALEGPQVGVIGTREPTRHGAVATQRITEIFVEKSYSIVSGLALGCDSLSHAACVEANGKAIAVLAHGLHTVAPKRSAALADAILNSGGLLISEFAFGVEPQPRLFVQRDKTQALLSQAIVMMQSDLKGGSLHASRAAVKYGRGLIIPYPTTVDIENLEPKIQANLVLADGDVASKTELLMCTKDDLAHLMVVRGREHYAGMFEFIESVRKPEQTKLL